MNQFEATHLLEYRHHHPVLYGLPYTVAWSVHNDYKAGVFVNQAVLLLTLLLVYKIANRLANRFFGLIAVILTLTNPVMISQSRQVFYPFFFSLVILYSLDFVLKSPESISPRDIVCYFIVLGLSGLMSHTFFSFAFPAAILAFNVLRSGSRHHKQAYLIGLLLCAAILHSWWIQQGIPFTASYLEMNRNWMIFFDSSLTLPERIGVPLLYLLQHLSLITLGIPMAATFALCGIYALFRMRSYPTAVLACFILIPGIVWAFFDCHDLYPFYPAIPAIMIFISLAFFRMSCSRQSLPVFIILLLVLIHGTSNVFFSTLNTYEEIRDYIARHSSEVNADWRCLLSAKCLKDCDSFAKLTFNDCTPFVPVNYLAAVSIPLVPVHQALYITSPSGESVNVAYVHDESRSGISSDFSFLAVAQGIASIEFKNITIETHRFYNGSNPSIHELAGRADYLITLSNKTDADYYIRLLQTKEVISMETYLEDIHLYIMNNSKE